MQVAILPAEQGTRSTDDAVAAGVVLPSIAIKRVGPTACVVRCSGDSASRACDAYADQCPPRMSTCNTRTAHGSERATGPRLSALDRQRDAALLRPAEGQYCCACEGRGHNGKLSKTSLFHGVPPKVAPVDVYYLLRVCSRARSKNPRPMRRAGIREPARYFGTSRRFLRRLPTWWVWCWPLTAAFWPREGLRRGQLLCA
jgi:hypothetical protein